jgi:hypothetical protein
LAFASAGKSRLASIAIMAITTSNSISVNPDFTPASRPFRAVPSKFLSITCRLIGLRAMPLAPSALSDLSGNCSKMYSICRPSITKGHLFIWGASQSAATLARTFGQIRKKYFAPWTVYVPGPVPCSRHENIKYTLLKPKTPAPHTHSPCPMLPFRLSTINRQPSTNWVPAFVRPIKLHQKAP